MIKGLIFPFFSLNSPRASTCMRINAFKRWFLGPEFIYFYLEISAFAVVWCVRWILGFTVQSGASACFVCGVVRLQVCLFSVPCVEIVEEQVDSAYIACL